MSEVDQFTGASHLQLHGGQASPACSKGKAQSHPCVYVLSWLSFTL